MKGNVYTLVYAAVLAIVCATTLTAVGELTKERRAQNKKAEKARNLMAVLGIEMDPGASAAEVLAAVDERGIKKLNRNGEKFETYDHPEAGRLWVIEFKGQGMWGPIKGMLSLDDDWNTIYAVSFYEQEETPGLGGEIDSAGFKAQFKDKTIRGADGKPRFWIVGGEKGDNKVDAISGATTTCKKVEKMLNDRIVELLSGYDGKEGTDGR